MKNLKCGYNSDSKSSIWQMVDKVEHIVMKHNEHITTKGDKRTKKVICIPSGKYWYESIPDLREVK